MAALAALQCQFRRNPSLSVRFAQWETNHARSHGLGEFKVSKVFVVFFSAFVVRAYNLSSQMRVQRVRNEYSK